VLTVAGAAVTLGIMGVVLAVPALDACTPAGTPALACLSQSLRDRLPFLARDPSSAALVNPPLPLPDPRRAEAAPPAADLVRAPGKVPAAMPSIPPAPPAMLKVDMQVLSPVGEARAAAPLTEEEAVTASPPLVLVPQVPKLSPAQPIAPLAASADTEPLPEQAEPAERPLAAVATEPVPTFRAMGEEIVALETANAVPPGPAAAKVDVAPLPPVSLPQVQETAPAGPVAPPAENAGAEPLPEPAEPAERPLAAAATGTVPAVRSNGEEVFDPVTASAVPHEPADAAVDVAPQLPVTLPPNPKPPMPEPLAAASPVPDAEPAPLEPPATEAPILPPTIDTIQIGGTDNFVAGDAPEGSTVRLYLDDQPAGESDVHEGRWLVEGVELSTAPQQILRVEAIDNTTGKLLGTGAIYVEIELPDDEQLPPQQEADAPSWTDMSSSAVPSEAPAVMPEEPVRTTPTAPPKPTSELLPQALQPVAPRTAPAPLPPLKPVKPLRGSASVELLSNTENGPFVTLGK